MIDFSEVIAEIQTALSDRDAEIERLVMENARLQTAGKRVVAAFKASLPSVLWEAVQQLERTIEEGE